MFCVMEWKVLEKHNGSPTLEGWLEQKQGTGPLSCELTQLLFSPTPSLLERTADTRGLFRLGYLAAVSSTMKSESLSSRKTATLFVANGKIGAFKQKSELCKTCYLPP